MNESSLSVALIEKASQAQARGDDGQLRLAFFDYAACVLDGWKSEVTQRAIESSLFPNTSERWAISAAAHSFDGIDPVSGAHAGNILLSTLSEFAIGLSPEKAAHAYWGGLFVIQEIGRWAGPGVWKQGWHPTSILGVFGSAYSASVAMGLGPRETAQALSFAASQSSGGHHQSGCDAKILHSAFCVQAGIRSAALAREGFSANAEPFNGADGWLRRITGTTGQLSAITDCIPIQFKPYPCCAYLFVFIDALLRLGVPAAAVGKITCFIPEEGQALVDRRNPTTDAERRHSLQFVLSTILRDRRLTTQSFANETEKELLEFRFHRVASWSHAAIRIEFIDGKTLFEPATNHLGDVNHPMGTGEVEAKLRECSEESWSRLRALWPTGQHLPQSFNECFESIQGGLR